MTEDLTALRPDHVVDSRGTLCPVPVLAAGKALKDVPVGGVMEVRATDAGAAADIPAWARRAGHDYLGMLQEKGYLRLFVRRTA
jgi:TusA-related sulfurtransferase